jgi:hypothetical protein
MHGKQSSSNNLQRRENADRDHQAETKKRLWQWKLTAPLQGRFVCIISDLLTYRLGKMPRNHAKDEADEAISFYIVAVFLGYSRCT